MYLRKIIGMAALGILLSTLSATAQENKFKALFLNKFVQYIEWPVQDQKVTIGVLGKSDVYNELLAVTKGKSNIKVIQIYSVEEYAKCDVIYVPQYMGVFIEKLDSKIGNQSILVVSDDKDHAGKSADIGFYIENQRLLFMIDPSNLRAKKLNPSSRLLNLGQSV